MFGARLFPSAAINDQGWKPLGLCTYLADQPCYEITYKASNNDSSKYRTRTSNNSSNWRFRVRLSLAPPACRRPLHCPRPFLQHTKSNSNDRGKYQTLTANKQRQTTIPYSRWLSSVSTLYIHLPPAATGAKDIHSPLKSDNRPII